MQRSNGYTGESMDTKKIYKGGSKADNNQTDIWEHSILAVTVTAVIIQWDDKSAAPWTIEKKEGVL